MRAMYRITVLEALRRRVALALAGVTALVVSLSGWGLSAATRTHAGFGGAGRLINDYQLLVFFVLILSGLFALTAILVSAPSLATEIESHVILAELARPISRRALLLGKWLGLTAVVCAFVVVMAGAEMVVVASVVHIVVPHPVEAVAFLVGQALVLVTLSVLLSTRLPPVTSGIVAMAGYFLSWMAGLLGGVGTSLHRADLQHIATAVSLLIPSDGLWRGAVFSLEPTSLVSLALSINPAIAGSPFLVLASPAVPFLVWSVLWVGAILLLAGASLGRREL